MSKVKTIKVCLRRGHPNRVMLARLANGEVIQIGEDGVELAPEQISREMRECKWFEGIDGAAAEVVDLSTGKDQDQGNDDSGAGSDDGEGAEGGLDEGSEAGNEGDADEDPAGDKDEDPVVLTPAQKAARTRAANKAKKDAAAKRK